MPVVAWMLIATNKCFDMEHFAYSFALKNFLNCQVIGVPAPALIDGQCSLVVISKLDQLICFSSGQTKGLFRDHMLSCAQHLPNNGKSLGMRITPKRSTENTPPTKSMCVRKSIDLIAPRCLPQDFCIS